MTPKEAAPTETENPYKAPKADLGLSILPASKRSISLFLNICAGVAAITSAAVAYSAHLRHQEFQSDPTASYVKAGIGALASLAYFLAARAAVKT